MNCVGVIPARWRSTRFEGKVLADLAGKPLIQHVWERAKQARELDQVLIACDDARVFEAARRFGAEAVMTSPEHVSGTDRVAEAVRNLQTGVVVNIQGDEPTVSPDVIDRLCVAMKCPGTEMATVVVRSNDPEVYRNPNRVKVVRDENGDALYFSRAPVPADRDHGVPESFWIHLGMYAYTRDFLLEYTSWPPGKIEVMEKLEQLRVLERGHKIRCVESDEVPAGVDTPQDLQNVVKILKDSL